MYEHFDYTRFKKYPEIEDIRRCIASFEISYHRAPKDLRVDVYESMSCEGYYPSINYGFWGPNQGGSYKALHVRDSISDALREAIWGIVSNDSSEYPNYLVFWVGDSGKIFDGDGKLVSNEEVLRRRKDIRGKVFKQIRWTDTSIVGGPFIIAILNDTSKKAVVIDNCDVSKIQTIIKEVSEKMESGLSVRYLDEKMSLQPKSAFIDHLEKNLNFTIQDYDDYKNIFLDD